MLQKSKFILGIFICLFCTSYAQLIEDFAPNKLTWTESPAKGLWQIGTHAYNINSLHGDNMLGTVGYGDNTSLDDLSITSSTFEAPALSTSAEKIFLEFFSWNDLKSTESVYIYIDSTDGSSPQYIGYISDYYNRKKWTYNSIDISKYAGKQIKLIYKLDVISYAIDYASNNYLGVFIDDIRLRKSSTPVEQPIIMRPILDMGIAKNKFLQQNIEFIYKSETDISSFDVSSSNTTLIPTDSVKITVSNGVYQMRISPLENQTGSCEIIVNATSGTYSDSKRFKVYVNNPQMLINETFEIKDYMSWTKEPLSGKLFAIGETTLVDPSGPNSQKVLGLSLINKVNVVEGQTVKIVSNSFQLPATQLGTYLLSFKNFKGINGCCGEYPKVKIREENGTETVVLDLDVDDYTSWKEVQLPLSKFEGKRIQIVFEIYLYGSSNFYFSSSEKIGWFIDDVQISYIGSSSVALKPFSINKIPQHLQQTLSAVQVPFTVFNPQSKNLTFQLNSSNTIVVKNSSLKVLNTENPYLLNFAVVGDGETTIRLIARDQAYADTTYFKIVKPNASNKDSLLMLTLFKNHNLAAADYNWDKAPMHKWVGVELNNSRRIKSLDLYIQHQILGFPIEITQLDSLEKLTIGNRFFVGKIPAEIGNLKALESLIIRDAHISGKLPNTIGQLKKLKTLVISSTNLTLEFPEEIGDLSALEELELSWSNTHFTFPKDIFRIASLKSVNIYAMTTNNTTLFPAGISNLKNLESFVCDCGFSGNLPEELGTLTNLKTLNLSSNHITGLPTSIGNLQNLESLGLHWNQLKNIPSTIGNLKKLKGLSLSSNQLEGPFPNQISELTSLENLSISNNQLTGALPNTLVNLQNLKSMDVGFNKLTFISPTFNQLNKLTSINLTNNLFDSIPNFSNNAGLAFIYPKDNYLGFLDLERNPKINASYRSQKERPLKFLTQKAGTNITLKADVTGQNNQYQWYKEGQLLTGQTAATLILINLTPSDQADYQCYVTNTLITNLTIKSSVLRLLIQQDNNTLPIIADTTIYMKNNDYYRTLITFKSKDAEGDSLFYYILKPTTYTELAYRYGFKSNYNAMYYNSDAPIETNILYYDKRGLSDTIKVFLYISSPSTSSYSLYYIAEVTENAPVGTEIYKLQVNDVNNGIYKYSTSSSLVSVDSISGSVTTTSSFLPDFDLRNSYVFNFEAKNAIGDMVYINLHTNILPALNVQNADPLVQDQIIKILKSTAINSVIGNINARDRDQDILSYQIQNVDSKFDIKDNGEIVVKTALDPISDSISKIKVRVFDHNGGNTYINITILTTETISVHDAVLSSLKVYPTVVTNSVQVEAEHTINQIQLIDLQGRILGNWYPGQKQYTVATNDFEPSQYLLKIFSDHTLSQHKIIITK